MILFQSESPRQSIINVQLHFMSLFYMVFLNSINTIKISYVIYSCFDDQKAAKNRQLSYY